MQEDAMNGFTDIGIATEREREVTDTTTHVGTRQILMNPLGGTDEFHGIVVVLLHTRSDGEYVRVKDDVERIHAQLVHQQPVSTLSYLNTALKGSCLTHFIEAHHHHGSTIAHHVPGMREEYLLTLLQRDGIDDALALAAFQSSQDYLPFRGVYHHRNLGYLRLSRYHIEEVHHLSLRIQQSVVHIDVYHGSSVSHLLACDTDGFLITFFINQTQELPATSHVTALTHVHEPAGVHRQMNGVIDLQKVQSREPHILRLLHHLMRFLSFSQSGIMSDEFGTCATAAADDVNDAFIDEFGDFRSHRLSRLVIFAHFVRQAGIRMGAYIIRCHLGKMLDKRLHLRRTEGAVHTHGEDRIRRERG